MDDRSGCHSLADLIFETGRRPTLAKTIFDGTKLPLVEKPSQTTTGGMNCTGLPRDQVLKLRVLACSGHYQAARAVTSLAR
jgi:hypothetical protein